MRERAGIALFAALAILGLVALLVVGALASFRLAMRSSSFATTDAVLTAAADFAVTSALSNARQLGFDTMSLGVARSVTLIPPSANGIAPTVVATRLAGGVVWLVADATAGGIANGRRRINLVARWRSPGPLPSSALVSRGDVRVAAGTTFGIDTTGDVDCRVAPAADVSVPPGASVTSPPGTSVLSTPIAADSSTYWLSRAQLAQLTAGPGVTHVAGDTTIAGGVFQGILIVDGVLTISGPFTATGILIARGPLVATSGGLVVSGAVMSFAPQTSVPAIALGPSIIRFSRCAIAAALRRAIPLRPVRERSWAELF